MDRQSNGSFIVKDKIISTYKSPSLITNNNERIKNTESEEVKIIINDKDYKSLKNIDDTMLSIEKQLDDIEK